MYKEAVKLLVENGVKYVNIRDSNGATPLHAAAVRANVRIARLLLANHADPNAQNNDADTPLHIAVINETKEQEETVELLIKKGANVNIKDRNGATPLHAAAVRANVRIARLLLANDADPNAQNNDADTPLHCAINEHNEIYSTIQDNLDDLFKLLIERGACIEKTGENGASLLHLAAYRTNTHIVELLLQKGADPNQPDDFCDISLHYVDVSDGVVIKLDIIDGLLRHGANPWAVGRRGIPACVLHFHHADEKEFESILHYTKDLFTVTIDESNFLSFWCFSYLLHCKQSLTKHEELPVLLKLKFLLGKSTDLHNRGALGRNSLHVILSPILKYLFKDDTVFYYRNPHVRLNLGSPTEWISLLRKHVDASLVNTKDDFGWTPANLILFYIEMASKNPSFAPGSWCIPLLTLFLEAGLKPAETDHHGASLLHHAAGRGSCCVLEKLIKHCKTFSVNQKDKYESTPLHYAVVADCKEATKILLRNGSDKNARDCKGRTAWDLAKLFGFLDIMKLLGEATNLFETVCCCACFNERKSVKQILHNIKMGIKPSEVELISLLKSPVFGSIEYQEDCFKEEAQKVKDEVMQLVDMLSKLYNEQFPHFSLVPKLRGSMAEGTKSGPPNEFDVMLIMNGFTKYFEVKSMDFDQVHLSVAQPVSRDYPNIYWLTGGNQDDALCHFNVTFHAILLKSEIWKQTRLHFVHFTPMRVGANLVLKYNGFLHKHLKISIDLVPCFPLASDVKPPDIRWPVPLDFSKCKCYALFEKYDVGSQRVSYSDYEEVLVNTLPIAAKDAYVVAKAACLPADFQYDGPSYELKGSLLVSYARLLKIKKGVDHVSIAEWVRVINNYLFMFDSGSAHGPVFKKLSSL